MERAACIGEDPELFFPDRGDSHRPGKAICAGCDVGDECLSYSLRTNSEYGMWNGQIKQRKRTANGNVGPSVHDAPAAPAPSPVQPFIELPPAPRRRVPPP